MPMLAPMHTGSATPGSGCGCCRPSMMRLAAVAASVSLVPRQQHQELVAADAADHVGLAHECAQALAQRLQQQVAGGVTMGVVDHLEMVEIDEQQGHRVAVAAGLRGGEREQFAQQGAVGQAGQVVVHRHATQFAVLLLELVDQAAHLGVHGAQVTPELAQFVVT